MLASLPIVMTPSALRALVERIAREAGAGDVKIASAGDDAATQARFAASLERGDLATWPYDDAYAQKAASPQALLAGARSVICVAVPYATQAPHARGPLTGRISNYAWSVNYHRHVRAVLKRIADELDAAIGAPVTRAVCDTAPLAERAFAERSGLGWIGKHTNLISPELGSFVFLGEIVTTLDLPPDAPSKKSCGSCTRCIDVCPTGALRADYSMDATRCISDLTQRTDAIPRELRALMGDWIWGCDLCQEVCPPTQRASPRVDAVFSASGVSAAFPGLLALLRMRGAEHRRRFRPKAMGWRRPAVLRRNAAVALGNALDRAAVPALLQALREDGNPLVRGHAAWALGRIGSPRALDALSERLASETELTVREEIALALASWETFALR